MVADQDEGGAGEVKKNICYKCGIALTKENRTRDHIPPKCFVNKEDYKNLIIVPSCKSCNEGRSKDDEYFRNWITVGGAHLNPTAKEIYKSKTKISWQHRPGIKIGMRRMLKKENIFTPAGLYLGERTYIYMDEHRGLPVIDSIAKGILWRHFGSWNIKFPHNITPSILEDPDLGDEKIKIIFDCTMLVTLIG